MALAKQSAVASPLMVWTILDQDELWFHGSDGADQFVSVRLERDEWFYFRASVLISREASHP